MPTNASPALRRPFRPHPRADARRASAVRIAELLVREPAIVDEHMRELLGIALWKFTEADGKFRTRYRSAGVLSNELAPIEHDHVITRKELIERMRSHPDQIEQLMRLAEGCLVTVDEHRRLTAVGDVLSGWDRYRLAGVDVFDMASVPPAPWRPWESADVSRETDVQSVPTRAEPDVADHAQQVAAGSTTYRAPGEAPLASRQRLGEILQAVLEVLAEEPGGALAATDVRAAVAKRLELTERELEVHPRHGSMTRFDMLVSTPATIAAATAGWLAKRSELWAITTEGRAALAAGREPVELIREAVRRYNGERRAPNVVVAAE